MTADLELFLRGVGRYRHQHVFDRYDIATDSYMCRCGAGRVPLEFNLQW